MMFEGASVAVVGMGASGRAAAIGLRELGATVLAFDSNESAAQTASQCNVTRFQVFTQPLKMAEAIANSGCNLVVTSPGVPQHHPIYNLNLGAEVISEVELAWRIQKADVSRRERPWMTVTGTNGKTTTVGMAAAIATASGLTCPAVGNVGKPIITTILDGNYDALAVELSSFQLYSTTTLEPAAAVCLNIDADHLDWHGSVQAYQAAKARVYEHTRLACLYPVGDEAVIRMVEDADVMEGARAIGLSLNAPAISQIGLVDDLIIDRAFLADRHHHALEIATLDDLPNRATPTVMDALAAAGLTRAIGVEPAAVAAGLRSFQPAPHRCVDLGEKLQVRWIDDSKATNAHAAAASLSGMPPRSVVWIAGGDTKGQSFDSLVERIEPCLRGVVLIGVDARPLAEALRKYAPNVPVQRLEPHPEIMESAVHEAVALSRPGDRVILAPACASWDQFESYGQRGDEFARVVAGLEGQELTIG